MNQARCRDGLAITKCEDGSAAVEFALVIPFFLLCVMAVIQSGFLIYTQSVLSRLAEIGQRHLLFEPDDDTGTRDVIIAGIKEAGFDPKLLEISIQKKASPFVHVELALDFPFQFLGPVPLPDTIPIRATVVVPMGE